jgi:hypothetical protein
MVPKQHVVIWMVIATMETMITVAMVHFIAVMMVNLMQTARVAFFVQELVS